VCVCVCVCECECVSASTVNGIVAVYGRRVSGGGQV
jgi:hypothetical protein